MSASTSASPPVFVIAEAGVNHNGDADLALQLVEAAAAAGADAVKFQTFSADRLVSRDAPKAAYQKAATGDESQYEMLKRLELPAEAYFALKRRADQRGIEFLSTPFDEQAADFLAGEIGVHRLKIASGEITNGPLLLHIARLGLPMILSTGASTLEDVEEALGLIGFGLHAPPDATPSRARLGAYREEAEDLLKEKVVLLHCTTEYPAPPQDANLKAMQTMRERFGLPIGLSDHSAGVTLPIAGAALGAVCVEKHFTLDRSLPGPDHSASLDPDELARMVSAIRDVSAAMGDGRKRPQASERENRTLVRRSLVAAEDIDEGASLTAELLAVRRPGRGASPMAYWDVLGRRAARAYRRGEPIDE